MDSLEQRVKALPEDHQKLMASVPSTDIKAYSATLAHCEAMAGQPVVKPPQQGGVATPGITNLPLDKFDAALKAADGEMLKALRKEHGPALDQALTDRHAKMKA